MRDELDIPMPRMAPAAAPSYRVALSASRMDAATKRLAVIAAAIGGALLLLVGVWSLSGHRGAGGVPVVEADSRPLRTKPDQPGGMQVAGENETILSGVTGGKDAMAPPPEVPAPQALKAEADQQLAVKTAAAAVPDPVALTPPATLPDAAGPKAAATTVIPAPALPALQPALPATPPAALATQPAPASAKTAAPAISGTPAVQLAALQSEPAAMEEWQRLTRKMPALLGDRHPAVVRADHDGKTFYRLRTGGFADIAKATAFCEQVRAKGGGCALARF